MAQKNLGVGTQNLTSDVMQVMAGTFAYEQSVPIESTQYNRIDGFVIPVGGLNNWGPYEFELPAMSTNSYLNMDSIYLYGKARIQKEVDGADVNLDEADEVAPINLFGSMFVRNLEVRLNDNMLPGSSGNDVNYKNYVETLLSYEESCTGHLESQIFSMDDVDQFNVIGTANDGFVERELYVQKSQVFDFTTPINADFLKSDHHLGPGNKLNLTIYRASDEFLLMCKKELKCKVKLEELRLYFSRIESTQKRLNPEQHFITHTELSRFPQAAEKTNFTLPVNIGGVLPRTVVVFFVNTSSYNGAYNENPLQFKHLGIEYLALRVNGKTVPQDGLRTNFRGDSYRGLLSRAYLHLFQNTATNRINRGNLMTLERFHRDYTVFPFDLTPDFCNGYHIHEANTGVLEVDVRCTNMTEATQAMVYCAYEMNLAILADGRHDLNYFTSHGDSSSSSRGGGGKRGKKRKKADDEDEEFSD